MQKLVKYFLCCWLLSAITSCCPYDSPKVIEEGLSVSYNTIQVESSPSIIFLHFFLFQIFDNWTSNQPKDTLRRWAASAAERRVVEVNGQ